MFIITYHIVCNYYIVFAYHNHIFFSHHYCTLLLAVIIFMFFSGTFEMSCHPSTLSQTI